MRDLSVAEMRARLNTIAADMDEKAMIIRSNRVRKEHLKTDWLTPGKHYDPARYAKALKEYEDVEARFTKIINDYHRERKELETKLADHKKRAENLPYRTAKYPDKRWIPEKHLNDRPEYQGGPGDM